jgi:hypothetical protein
MIMDGGGLLWGSFKKYLPFGVLMTLFYIVSFPDRGLISIIRMIFIVNVSSFTIFLIYLYLTETVRSTIKTIILSIIPFLSGELQLFMYSIFMDEALPSPFYIRRFLAGIPYLTIAYIPFGIYLYIKESPRNM